MKTNITMTVLALSLIVGAGCKGRQETAATQQTAPAATQAASASATPANATPEQLGTLGAEIKKSPNDAHKLITQQGMTEESFAAAVRKVSEDPAAAKRYATAYKQASS